jgi:hypothetical protein
MDAPRDTPEVDACPINRAGLCNGYGLLFLGLSQVSKVSVFTLNVRFREHPRPRSHGTGPACTL